MLSDEILADAAGLLVFGMMFAWALVEHALVRGRDAFVLRSALCVATAIVMFWVALLPAPGWSDTLHLVLRFGTLTMAVWTFLGLLQRLVKREHERQATADRQDTDPTPD